MVHGKCQKNLKYTKVMLNPESVILNLVQNLFRAGLFQHLIKSNKTDPEINSG
jgi:hypothetical protein